MAHALDIRFARAADAAVVSSILVEAATWTASLGLPLWPIEQLSAEAIAPGVAAGSFILASVESEGVGTARLTQDDPECWPDAVPGVAVYVHCVAIRRAWAGLRALYEGLGFQYHSERNVGRHTVARYERNVGRHTAKFPV